MTTLTIGLVSISDRASRGAYDDKGLPSLEEWLGTALEDAVAQREAPDSRRAAGHRAHADRACATSPVATSCSRPAAPAPRRAT